MILSEIDIQNIILKNPNKALIDAGRKYNNDMRKHFYGHGLDAALTTIEGFEKDALRTLRAKYAKSNKDLFNRLARPIDKVFSARGGSLYTNLPEAQDRKAKVLSLDVTGGKSIKKWLDNSWRKHYLDDPFGLIFLEIYPVQKALQLKSQGKSFVYPTYKSIQCIYDYQPNGSNIEYVVFTVDNKEKIDNGYKVEDEVYRVVDDAFDYYVKREDNNVYIQKQHTLPNYFTYVPGIINSDIPDPNMDGGHLSLFEDIRGLADTFLLKGSIKLTHEFLFAFPKYWEYADDCKKCSGTKLYEGKACPECKGTGKSIMSKVSDAKVISWPKDKDDPIITPNVAGFVSPDKVYYDIATHDLQLLEDLMHFTIWGASNVPKSSGIATDANGPAKTATEITGEIKPQSDRLEQISECAENRHKFILDGVIKIQIDNNYQGSSVNYGKRFMIEGPDAIWDKYSKARKDGAASSVLDDLLMEYYEAKYNSDPVKLAIQVKLMKVEPFVHLTTSQLKPLGAGDDDYKAKLYFSEWLSTVSDAEIISYDSKMLRGMMITYSSTKQIATPDNKLLPAA